ncbi:MAG: hypothetical protein EVA89_10860 [Sandaracinaceae bacterium]|nr:MAG: hypothetical protein EVA89_10860 [Sandaracinaceae bacterium]
MRPYAEALETVRGISVDDCCVVRADKTTGKYRAYCPPDAVWQQCRKQWRRVLRLFHWDRSIERAVGIRR